jgi:pimeloyl-ACP methyl ester carboxylesterase
MTKQTSLLETDGARIYYDVGGSGEPILFIHAGVADLRMWDDQVAALQDAYRVIRYDTRGFGRTETDAVPFSNRADIAALLDHLDERSAHVVGLSRGGMIGLDFALEFPERVRSLTVAAGGIGGRMSPNEAPDSTWEEPERLIEAKDWDGIAEWETAYWADGPGQPATRVPEVRAKVHDWVLRNYEAQNEEGQPQPLQPPAVERLGELRAPLLVLVGTLDDPGTVESMRFLASVVPGARLEQFETAHLINLEQPERFNRVLRAFVDSVAAVAPSG